ncbi:hypothetical protein EJB05_53912, partial [Eragrostis curvula]
MAGAARLGVPLLRFAAGTLLALASLLSPPVAQRVAAIAPFLPWQVCRNSGNYSANSTYESNLKQLAATVPTNVSSSPVLFVNGSVGTAPDTVYILALCRDDINGSANMPLNSLARYLKHCFQLVAQQLCPLDRDAAVFQELCYARFSDLNFLATLDNGEPIVAMSPQNVSSAMIEALDDAVGIPLDATIEYAVTNSSRRFATAEEGFHSSNPPSIYGMARCTPDMSPAECRKCLEVLNSKMRSLSGRQNGWLGGLRCHLRYAVYYFFYEAPMLQLPAPPVPAPTPSPVNVTPTSGGTVENS